MVPPSPLRTSEEMSYPLAERKLDINKKTWSFFFFHVFVYIRCRYRLIPKISLVTDFRSPVFDSVAPLNMVMSADPPISVTEKVRACSYILNLLSQI